MAEEKKIVKGGFRSTLALIISIIAFVLAFIAFDRSGDKQELNAQIKHLQERVEKMKQETEERVEKMKQETAKSIDKVRKETANVLEKMGKAIKKEEKEESTQ